MELIKIKLKITSFKFRDVSSVDEQFVFSRSTSHTGSGGVPLGTKLYHDSLEIRLIHGFICV